MIERLLGIVALTTEPRSAAPARAPSRERLDVGALYRRYGDMVLGRCRGLLGNEADAQEAAQDVFLKLHRYRDGFRGEASPTTYLFKVTTTTCLNRIRTRKRRPEDPVEELPASTDNDSLLDRLEIRQLVDELLADEDERTTSCMIYHFVDGMTHAEVGELLGISGAAVRKRIGVFKAKVAANLPAWMPSEEAP